MPHGLARPVVMRFDLPEREKHAAFLLQRRLDSLADYIENFVSAINLFEFCRDNISAKSSQHDFRNWQFIAARDGVMTIYHFGKSVTHLNDILNKIPSVSRNVDTKALRNARKDFSSYFQKIDEIRNAVAHEAEKYQNQDKFRTHSFSGSSSQHGIKISRSSNIMISNTISDRKFVVTYNGQMHACEISTSSLEKLKGIAAGVFGAFGPRGTSPSA